MATTTPPFISVAALILMCVGAAAAQSPAPSPSKGMVPGPSSYSGMAPGPSSYGAMTPGPMGESPLGDDCLTYVLNMSDCLSYVQDGSKLTVPNKQCCPELAGLLDSHALCLCQLVGSAATYGVNVSKALTLPGACNIATPTLSLCPGFAGSLPPAGSPPEASEGPTVGGSKAEPPEPVLGTSTMADSSVAFLLVLATSFLAAIF